MGVTTGSVEKLSTIQTSANLPESIQFGRVIEVIITNFKLNKAVKIPTDFDIEFSFFKTCDEVREASTGTVTIKNLKSDTIDLVSMRDECQMQLFCGYQGHVALLFVADIISVTTKTNGTNVDVVFVVSANYFQYKLSRTVSFTADRGASLRTILDATMDAIKQRKQDAGDTSSTTYGFDFPNYWSESDKKSFLEFFNTANITNNYSVNDDLHGILTHFCTSFGFTVTTTDNTQGKEGQVYVFSFANNFENYYLNKSKENYQKIRQSASIKTADLYNAGSSRVATTLSYQTGMVETPNVSYQVFTVPENWKLDSNSEQQTFESQVSVANKNAKESQRYQKYLQSSKKKIADGKKVKAFKKRKQGTIRIRKTMVSVKALINPNVRPQSIINLVTENDDLTGLFRVRSVLFEGSTRGAKFHMQILMDDTNGEKDKRLSDSEAAELQKQSEEGFGSSGEFGGSIGADYSEEQNVDGGSSVSSE